MRYYVLADGGQKYGPADEITLQQWVDENRITPTTMLQPETSTASVAAGSVGGLRFPTAQPPTPSAQSNYPRAGQPMAGNYIPPGLSGPVDTGNKDLALAFGLVFLTAVGAFLTGFITFICGAYGIQIGLRANAKGQKLGFIPVALCGLLIVYRIFTMITQLSGRSYR